MRIQRLRTTFSRGATHRYITHLDLMRFWERALRRAGVEIAYSEGFSPHPQISLAAPLPVGVTARAELMDVFLAERMSPRNFILALSRQLPPGLEVTEVQEVLLGLPSIQSQMRAAEYEVTLPADGDSDRVKAAVKELLGRQSVPWQHMRERELRSYDLRPLVYTLTLRADRNPPVLHMRLRADNDASGRPDQVLAALGLTNLPIERTALILADDEKLTGRTDLAEAASGGIVP
jgi:radical SAM-linked protein